MGEYDDDVRLRDRDDDLKGAMGRIDKPMLIGAPCVLLKTTQKTTYPTVAARFFYCEVLNASGVEIDGGPATTTPLGTFLYAYNLGPTLPPVGSIVVGTYVSNRWVFQWPNPKNAPPCPPTTKVTFSVSGCTSASVGLPGATIDIEFQEEPLPTGTTDATGQYFLDNLLQGTYYYSITKKIAGVKRYSTVKGSFFVATSCSPQTISAQLLAETGFVCCPSVGGAGGTIEFPFSKKMLCTYGGGSETLTWTGNDWESPQRTFLDNNSRVCDTFGRIQCIVPSPHDVKFWVFMACNGNGGQNWVGERSCTAPHYNVGGPCDMNLQLNVQGMSGFSNTPLTTPAPWTFTVPSMDNLFGEHRSPYPGTMTVSEILP